METKPHEAISRAHLGQEILRQVQELPRWVISITANRQRLARRVDRQLA